MSFNAEHEVAKQLWENHDDKEYIKDQSHWRGIGRWKNDSDWINIGKSTLQRLKWIMRADGIEFEEEGKKNTILEWGPGGGANAVGLMKYCNQYYGIDISKLNLDEAARVMQSEGSNAFIPIHLKTSPNVALDFIPEESIDIFISTAVFQHFPSKEYGMQVLKVMRKLLKKKSISYIQFRFDNGNPKYKPNESISDYKNRHIYSNSYSIDEFWAILVDLGYKPLCVSNVSQINNYASIYFK
jgi:hypothetical protein